LILCAVYLNALAASGRFTGTFYAVQTIELIAGLVNLTLMALNIKFSYKQYAILPSD
jgi:hypothetical protein